MSENERRALAVLFSLIGQRLSTVFQLVQEGQKAKALTQISLISREVQNQVEGFTQKETS